MSPVKHQMIVDNIKVLPIKTFEVVDSEQAMVTLSQHVKS